MVEGESDFTGCDLNGALDGALESATGFTGRGTVFDIGFEFPPILFLLPIFRAILTLF